MNPVFLRRSRFGQSFVSCRGGAKQCLGPVASQTRIEVFPQIADSQNVTLDFLRCASVNIAIFKVVSSSFSQRFVWWILYDLLSKSI